jgi:GT2 family glycosyltransferase
VEGKGETMSATERIAREAIASAPAQATMAAGARPRAHGKFLRVGGEELYVRGVTYGTFEPDENGDEFPPVNVVRRDFAAMAQHGVNAIRTYTAPPRWMLDVALEHGLWVMVGLAAERYVGYLIDRKGAPSVTDLVSEGVRRCKGHPAVLCYAVANEIPAPVVRWLGRRRAQRLIERLIRTVRAEDPDALVTYVNYPSTEYLQLPSVDVVCFNVYLEERETFDAYLARMQVLAGDRPLIMGELGLDSRRNGEAKQARTLDWQISSAFEGGCAGAFVYAWTDSWYRGGEWVTDWDFGLTRRDRSPKPALASVAKRFAALPVDEEAPWPRFSVVVCSYNGSRTMNSCLRNLMALDYPDFEVIVVDDGSTDSTDSIAAKYPVHLISSENRGLSFARNLGLEAASGDLVAYVDDDAYPDPHWLRYLAVAFRNGECAGVGGPNIVPLEDGLIAQCVARSPGGPIHVLISDREAEHIPGCNMAFRRSALLSVGGFDPQFWIAGDDVDVCWRLQAAGWKLGFHPAALVWHHRRNSVRAYWRQQRNYGRAEALLERKWPEKYNAAGHVRWAGRIYGPTGMLNVFRRRSRVYHGVFGSAPFQMLQEPRPSVMLSILAMPEWYLLIALLAAVSALSTVWLPLLAFAPLTMAAIAVSLLGSVRTAAEHWQSGRGRGSNIVPIGLTAMLHLTQPLMRLSGRLGYGLAPWRRRHLGRVVVPYRRTFSIWTERWHSSGDRLGHLMSEWRSAGVLVVSGGPTDRWDLEVRGGLLGRSRLRMALEDHPGATQLIRIRTWPYLSRFCVGSLTATAALACAAAFDGAGMVGVVIGVLGLVLASSAGYETAIAQGAILSAVDRERGATVVEDLMSGLERMKDQTQTSVEGTDEGAAARREGAPLRLPI